MVIVATILGLLPGLAWLYFYLKEDCHPEPKKLLVLTFFAGAFVTVFAFVAQKLSGCSFFKYCDGILLEDFILLSPGAIGIGLLILLALVEEVLKFVAAYFIVHKSEFFDEPIDAMIYMVVAGLGFATVENLGVVGVYFTEGSTTTFSVIASTISLRFVGATLLHALASGLVGYYWAKSVKHFGAKRFLFFGIALATILHAIFNYVIISYENIAYSLIFLITVGFFILNDFEKLKDKPA
jgi:protease PrsW